MQYISKFTTKQGQDVEFVAEINPLWDNSFCYDQKGNLVIPEKAQMIGFKLIDFSITVDGEEISDKENWSEEVKEQIWEEIYD